MKEQKSTSPKREQYRKRMLTIGIRQMLLKGMTSRQEMADALGVSSVTVGNYIKKIEARWDRDDRMTFRQKKKRRLEQLCMAAQKAMASYERSRQDEEEITTNYVQRKCKKCDDGLLENGDWCEACDGKGKVTSEVVSRRVRGKAGDSGHLRVFLEAVEKMIKLENLYPARKEQLDVRGKIGVVSASLDFSQAPPEVILEAKRAVDLLRASVNGRKQLAIDSEFEEA